MAEDERAEYVISTAAATFGLSLHDKVRRVRSGQKEGRWNHACPPDSVREESTPTLCPPAPQDLRRLESATELKSFIDDQNCALLVFSGHLSRVGVIRGQGEGPPGPRDWRGD